MWQLIASVAAPGYTIHTVVAAANWLLQLVEESKQARPRSRCWHHGLGWGCSGAERLQLSSGRSVPAAVPSTCGSARLGDLARKPIPVPCRSPAVQVAASLEQAAAALDVSPDIFLSTFNKSVPTALGLLGALRRRCADVAPSGSHLTRVSALACTAHVAASLLGLYLGVSSCCAPPLLPAAIPFIVHPIDGAVHAVLNATLRPAMRRYICREAGGAQAGLAICERCQD